MVIKAKYENGVFKPLEEVPVREGTVVQIHLPEEKAEGKRPRIRHPPPLPLILSSQ